MEENIISSTTFTGIKLKCFSMLIPIWLFHKYFDVLLRNVASFIFILEMKTNDETEDIPDSCRNDNVRRENWKKCIMLESLCGQLSLV